MNAAAFWTHFAASFCALVLGGYVTLWNLRRMARAFTRTPEFRAAVEAALKHVVGAGE